MVESSGVIVVLDLRSKLTLRGGRMAEKRQHRKTGAGGRATGSKASGAGEKTKGKEKEVDPGRAWESGGAPHNERYRAGCGYGVRH